MGPSTWFFPRVMESSCLCYFREQAWSFSSYGDEIYGEDKRFGCILFHIDIGYVIFEDIEIEWKDKTYVQNLDYWGVPLRCLLSKNVVHLHIVGV